MKRLLILLLGLVSFTQAASLRVVTTVPELADITRRIGGEHVQVESLARGREDIHNVPQRPSFIPKLNRADAVVLVGLELEHAFLPALLETAQNPKLLKGRDGHIDCSKGIKPLEVPEDLSRAQGELHPFGNPHYTMDPRQGFTIADTIMEGLSRLDSTHRAEFEKNRNAFKNELTLKLLAWREASKPLRGLKVVTHHPDLVYLSDFLGLQSMGTVEPKPGIPPTPAYLERLIHTMRVENVNVLVREIQYGPKTAEWIAQQTGAHIAEIATMGGAFPGTQDYFGFIDHNIRSILDAIKG